MQSYNCKPFSFPTAEVTVSFNPTSYTVNEGERVDFLLELTGEAQASVVVMFETRDGSAIGTYYTIPSNTLYYTPYTTC